MVYSQYNVVFILSTKEEIHYGNTDGTIKSERKFSCPSTNGLFVTIDKISLITINDDLISACEKQYTSGKSTSRSYKVTFVGPEGAGKTSSIRTLLNKPFDPKEPSTIGASLNFQAIVSFILRLLQQPEAQQGFELDRNTAVGWKEATVEDLTELLDKEYNTEVYEELEKLVRPVISPSTSSPVQSQEETVTQLEYEDHDDSDSDYHIPPDSTMNESTPQNSPALSASVCSPEMCNDTSQQSMNVVMPKYKEEVYQLTKRVVFGNKTDKLAVKASLSDFAGQMRFFHFQLLFLKRQDVVVLTVNASLNLHDPVIPREQLAYTRRKKKSGMMTAIQSLHYWLQSVSAHCGTSDVPVGSLSRRSPTVITCFTHADKLSEKQQIKVICIFRKSLFQKKYAAHLPDNDEDAFHMISNKKREKFSVNIIRLQLTLLKAAKPSLDELRPITYLKLEESIARKIEEGIDTINLLEFTILANQAGIHGDSGSEAISSCLEYCSKRGVILYYPEIHSLVDTVFISPQWLCNLLSHVIKAHDLKPREADLQRAWERYDQHGILEESFLDYILQQSGALQHKITILALTKHFFLLAEIVSNTRLATEPDMPVISGNVFIVPALLVSTPKQYQYKPEEYDQTLLFSFPDKYFPESIMNQILVKTINWSVSNGYAVHEYVVCCYVIPTVNL